MTTLRVEEIEVTPVLPRRRVRFLKGPIGWTPLATAARLPGRALAVFLAVHHRTALTGNATVTLPSGLLSGLGVGRDAKSRALHALEKAGLVSVERGNGRAARVTLKQTNGGT
jgi:hypothetical protein